MRCLSTRATYELSGVPCHTRSEAEAIFLGTLANLRRSTSAMISLISSGLSGSTASSGPPWWEITLSIRVESPSTRSSLFPLRSNLGGRPNRVRSVTSWLACLLELYNVDHQAVVFGRCRPDSPADNLGVQQA